MQARDEQEHPKPDWIIHEQPYRREGDLNDWFEEIRIYHRKDGKVVKEYDDLMSATRYGIMMLRYARSVQEISRFNRPLVHPKHVLA